jgi:hypothetical protein
MMEKVVSVEKSRQQHRISVTSFKNLGLSVRHRLLQFIVTRDLEIQIEDIRVGWSRRNNPRMTKKKLLS